MFFRNSSLKASDMLGKNANSFEIDIWQYCLKLMRLNPYKECQASRYILSAARTNSTFEEVRA